ncbi:hypothetical protein SIN8267_02057 [Sinobacterium norvegicum]|uniref:Uncharacterized protein n=1 Tax=Sinobacterium norvegicum TaxID=1641715 RepID=A0ABM9AFG6_9GAMM|nr:hypothetical protein [Sinobacterium norvegicum]CAH0991942.1 hypothetical protein SIN8267_02057 [Sinobacterium norvegicum]
MSKQSKLALCIAATMLPVTATFADMGALNDKSEARVEITAEVGAMIRLELSSETINFGVFTGEDAVQQLTYCVAYNGGTEYEMALEGEHGGFKLKKDKKANKAAPPGDDEMAYTVTKIAKNGELTELEHKKKKRFSDAATLNDCESQTHTLEYKILASEYEGVKDGTYSGHTDITITAK